MFDDLSFSFRSWVSGNISVSFILFQPFHVTFFVFQSGVVGGIMQVLLLSMSAHITKQLGMAPGGEFRAAFREVSKYFSYIVT